MFTFNSNASHDFNKAKYLKGLQEHKFYRNKNWFEYQLTMDKKFDEALKQHEIGYCIIVPYYGCPGVFAIGYLDSWFLFSVTEKGYLISDDGKPRRLYQSIDDLIRKEVPNHNYLVNYNLINKHPYNLGSVKEWERKDSNEKLNLTEKYFYCIFKEKSSGACVYHIFAFDYSSLCDFTRIPAIHKVICQPQPTGFQVGTSIRSGSYNLSRHEMEFHYTYEWGKEIFPTLDHLLLQKFPFSRVRILKDHLNKKQLENESIQAALPDSMPTVLIQIFHSYLNLNLVQPATEIKRLIKTKNKHLGDSNDMKEVKTLPVEEIHALPAKKSTSRSGFFSCNKEASMIHELKAGYNLFVKDIGILSLTQSLCGELATRIGFNRKF